MAQLQDASRRKSQSLFFSAAASAGTAPCAASSFVQFGSISVSAAFAALCTPLCSSVRASISDPKAPGSPIWRSAHAALYRTSPSLFFSAATSAGAAARAASNFAQLGSILGSAAFARSRTTCSLCVRNSTSGPTAGAPIRTNASPPLSALTGRKVPHRGEAQPGKRGLSREVQPPVDFGSRPGLWQRANAPAHSCFRVPLRLRDASAPQPIQKRLLGDTDDLSHFGGPQVTPALEAWISPSKHIVRHAEDKANYKCRQRGLRTRRANAEASGLGGDPTRAGLLTPVEEVPAPESRAEPRGAGRIVAGIERRWEQHRARRKAALRASQTLSRPGGEPARARRPSRAQRRLPSAASCAMLILGSKQLRYALFGPNQAQYPGRYVLRRSRDGVSEPRPHGVHSNPDVLRRLIPAGLRRRERHAGPQPYRLVRIASPRRHRPRRHQLRSADVDRRPVAT